MLDKSLTTFYIAGITTKIMVENLNVLSDVYKNVYFDTSMVQVTKVSLKMFQWQNVPLSAGSLKRKTFDEKYLWPWHPMDLIFMRVSVFDHDGDK